MRGEREHDVSPTADDAAYAERIARPLRGQERLSSAFGARVMDAVRVEARVRRSLEGRRTPAHDTSVVTPHTTWWRRARTVPLTPLTMLATAAGLAVAAAFGAFAAQRATPPTTTIVTAPAPVVATPPAPDTVNIVRFVFVDSTARNVALVGDFNAWSREATPLVRDPASGVWTASVTLPPGRHEYAFIVNGERWVADPFATRVLDDFGTESSVVTVGDRRS